MEGFKISQHCGVVLLLHWNVQEEYVGTIVLHTTTEIPDCYGVLWSTINKAVLL